MTPVTPTTLDIVSDLDVHVSHLLGYTKSLKVENAKLVKEIGRLHSKVQSQQEEIDSLEGRLSLIGSSKSIQSSEEIEIIKQQIETLIQVIDEHISYIK